MIDQETKWIKEEEGRKKKELEKAQDKKNIELRKQEDDRMESENNGKKFWNRIRNRLKRKKK